MTKKLYLGPGNRPRYSGGEAVLGGAVMGGGGGGGDCSNLRLYLSGEIKKFTMYSLSLKKV